MSAVIRWEEPPPDHGNKRPSKPLKYQEAADAMRARPGDWALIAEGKCQGTAGGLAWRVRNGLGPFAPPRAFEAKCVGPTGGVSSKVYARYLGDGSEA